MMGADTIFVAAIVVMASAYLASRVLRRPRGKKSPCGCGGCPGVRAKPTVAVSPGLDRPA